MIRIISIFLLVFTLFHTVDVCAQDAPKPIIILSGKITDESGRKLPGVTVIVKQNGSTLETMTTSSAGKFNEMELDYGYVYTIIIKMDGYATKTVVADTKKGYFEEDIQNPNVDFSINTALVKKMPDTDYSILEDRPAAKFEMDASGQFNPNVAYITQRSKEIDNYLKSLANKANEQEEKFKQLVEEGDNLVKNGNYDQAIQKYEEAVKIKEDDGVETKIADAENKLAELEEQKKVDEQFNATIKKGDNLLASNKFDEAIAAYNEAKGIKPSEKLPDQKIEEANKKKADANAAELQKQYAEKMKEADAAFAQKDYGDAKALYQEASTIKPDEQDPQKRISEIDALIKKQMEEEQKYNQFLADGNQAMLNEDYNTAIKNFEEALKIKPDEDIPKTELAKAKDLLAKQQEGAAKDKQYNDLITKADGEFGGEKWEQAKATYNQALAIKPNEQHPKDQITAIDAKLSEQADAAAKEKEYNDLITKADGEFGGEKWEQAKATYNQALAIKPNEQHPKDQITAIDAKLAELADVAAKEKEYNDLITKADGEFGGEKWEQAKATYNQALAIKPNEQHPKDQITAIDAKLSEQADAAAKEKEYNDLITKADGEFGGEKWEQAKATYNQALAIKPNEQHPKDQITAIDAKLSEQADAAAKEKEYNDLITKADGEFGGEKWEQAKATYNQALAIKPNEQHPKDQITVIDAKLAELAASDEKEKQFQDLISQGDEAKANKDWEKAKDFYKQAHNIKPDETLTQSKVDDVNNLMKEENDKELQVQYQKVVDVADQQLEQGNYDKARELYNRAKTINPNDTYPDQKLKELDDKIASDKEAEALDKKYNDALAKADNEFESEKWDNALISYQTASSIKPSETYPKDQIEKIKAKQAELANAASNEAAKREQYNALIKEADASFGSENWDDSKSKYEEALALYSNESYPQQQIDEINKKLAELAAANDVANQEKQLRDKYNSAIAKADAARDGASTTEQYETAKDLYKSANQIIPNESYPQEQVDWINKKLEELTRQEAQQQYDKLIGVADEKFAAKDYENAKNLYQRAKGMHPDDSYPPQKIKEIDQILADLAAQKANEAEANALMKKYNDAIVQADAKKNAKSYEEAKDLYKKAHDIKPDETYPQEMIDWINEQMKNDLADELEKQYRKIIGVADQQRDQENYDKAIQLYKRAGGMKPDDSYPPEQIAKIKELIAQKADKQKENDEYSTFINEGNSAFTAEDYRKALTAFKGAQGIKPTAPYPQQKIDEINKILSDLAEKQKQEQDAANNAARAEFLKNPYGEEVTGQYTEEEVDMILTQNRINDQDKNAEIVEKRKDDEAGKLDDEAVSQNEQILKNEEGYQEIETKRSEEATDNDQPRLKNIPEFEAIKDSYSSEESTRADYENSLNYNNYNQYEALETRDSKEQVNNDIPRQNNVIEMDNYKEEHSGNELEESSRQVEKAYDNYDSKEKLLSRITDFSVEADIPREENVVAVDNYKETHTSDDVALRKESDETTYDTYENYEELKTDMSLKEVGSDIPRQENVVAVDNYKENHTSDDGALMEESDTKTYETYESQEQLKTDMSLADVGSDIPRQENVVAVDNYKETHTSDDAALRKESDASTYANYENYEQLETERSEEEVDNDNPRKENVLKTDKYIDKNLAIESKSIESNTDRTYNTHVETATFEAERNNWMVEADVPRQENNEEFENYNSDRMNQKAEEIKEASDQSDERTEKYEEIKSQSPTMFSDENKQKLAEEYPQGVTEKMFQRKDANGEVIEVTILRIVVNGIKADEYKKVVTKWGTSYFKNNGIISEYTWDTETN